MRDQLRRLPLAAALALLLHLCIATDARATDRNWQRIASLPSNEGVAGAFAGVSGDRLIVAGGANFPDKKPWQGGQKVSYDAIYALDAPSGKWSAVGKLPRPLGYGVCVTYGDAIVCAGGGNAERNFADAFRIELRDGKATITSLPALPIPMANACGAIVGDTLYVAGGQQEPTATRTLRKFFALDLKALNRRSSSREGNGVRWRELEPWPGDARTLAVAGAYDGAFYLFGGVDLIAKRDETTLSPPERHYLRDAYRFRPSEGWKRIAALPRAAAAAPSPALNRELGPVILGGDDGTNLATPPDRHPGFAKSILQFDARHDKWTESGELPASHVTTPLVLWRKSWIIPSGEIRPGVRSPHVWSTPAAEPAAR